MLTFDESTKAKGRRLTAVEALNAYGFEKLLEVATDGSALISESVEAAGRTLRERREQLGLTVRQVASQALLSPEVVEALEAGRRRPIREYERAARVIGLDERMLSYRSDSDGNRGVAVRLRDLRDEKPSLTGATVITLAEAAWVAMTQLRLEHLLGVPGEMTFEQEPFYGTSGHPAYKVGYDLADAFRKRLDRADAPIVSMRDLVERELGIPVIQTDLGRRIAGATVESGGRRAIVVNLTGRNQSAFVRRFTVAHELCHILFDPRGRLRHLRVDEYDDLDKRDDQITDPVEQRANAFAVQLLAPQATALRIYHEDKSGDPLAHVLDHFGVSFTAARYQIWNGEQRRVPLESIFTDKYKPEADWEAHEAYTTTYHPIRALADQPERAGRFSAIVVRAAEVGIISWDTASEWLCAPEEEVRRCAPAIHELYPDVFDSASGGDADDRLVAAEGNG
jgi:Zn-dependent peptidase ImmA (M78 family)